MLAFPFWFQILFGFITGSLTTCVGLVLVNIVPELKKVALAGFCYALAVALARSLTLPFGTHFIILTVLLAIIIMLIWRLPIFRAASITIFGTLVLLVGESVFLPICLKAMNLNIDAAISKPLLAIFIPVPQIIFSIFIVLLCWKYRLYLVNYSTKGAGNSIHLNGKRFKIVIGLVLALLSLVIVQIVCNVTVFNIEISPTIRTLSLQTMGYLTNITVVLICLTTALLIIQFIELTDKESQLLIQSSYLETVEELYTALRAQKHDLANDWQVLYGLMQLGDVEEAQKYLEELMGKSISSENFVVTGEPGLSALLYIKSGIALSEGINFEVGVETLMNQKLISTYDLNRVVGNLINNAFDYVMNLEEERRIVQVRIFDDEDKQVVEVANCGNIDEDILEKIFHKGFTTKSGKHSGLGLHIVKELLEQNNGQVRVENRGDMALFSIYIPKGSVTKGGVHARSSQKDRGMAGGQI